jgi:hypothetical protein
MVKNLEYLIQLVNDATPLTGDEYPALKELSLTSNRLNFIVGHSLRHLSSSTGQMQKIVEHAEHGGILSFTEMSDKIVSALFSLLKLCHTLDMDEDDLIRGLEKMVNEYKENSGK